MAAPSNPSEFLDLLEQSMLVESVYVDKIRSQVVDLIDGDVSVGVKRLAQALTRKKVITRFQARQLVGGRYKGFYLGECKLFELLGGGGMGKVYLAEQIPEHRLVAVKIIRRVSKRKSEVMARFTREARVALALNHPNIVQAFDFDNTGEMPHIVMEYIAGLDVDQQVREFGPLNYKIACDYARQAALGLQHAHEADLVHRDIKPSNLLVDQHGLVKLVDLGLVAELDEAEDNALTADDDALGTVDYVAPEQAVSSKRVDIRADIYSLGATLYFMLSKQILLKGRTATDKLLALQTETPDSILKHVPDLPQGLADFLHRMIDREPDNRPQSPKEVAEFLTQYSELPDPPFDLKKIKYPQERMEYFLGRTPEQALKVFGKPRTEGEQHLAKTSETTREAERLATEITTAGLLAENSIDTELAAELSAADFAEETSLAAENEEGLLDESDETLGGDEHAATVVDLHAFDKTPDGLIGNIVSVAKDYAVPVGCLLAGVLVGMAISLPFIQNDTRYEPGKPSKQDSPNTQNATAINDAAVANQHSSSAEAPLPASAWKQTPTKAALASAMRSTPELPTEVVTMFGSAEMQHWNSVTQVAISADNSTIASAGADRRLHLWNRDDGTWLATPQQGEAVIQTVSFAETARRLCWGDETGNVSVWDIESEKMIWKKQMGEASVLSAAFTANDRVLAVGLRGEPSVFFFDAKTGELKVTFDLPNGLVAMGITADNELLATVTEDEMLRVWEVRERKIAHTYKLGSAKSISVDINHHKVTVVERGERSFTVFDMATENATSHSLPLPGNAVQLRRKTTLRDTIVLVSFGSGLGFFDLQSNQLSETRWEHAGQLTAMRWSADGTFVVTADDTGRIGMFESEGLKPETKKQTPLALAVTSQEDAFLLGGLHSISKIGNSLEAEFLLNDVPGIVDDISMSSEGGRFLTSEKYAAKVHMWDAVSGALIRTIPTSGRVRSLAWSPNSELFVTGEQGEGCFLRDAESGAVVMKLADSKNAVQQLRFTSDGSKIVASGQSRLVVWHSLTGRVLRTFTRDASTTTAVAIDATGNQILWADGSGKVASYDIEKNVRLRVWKDDACQQSMSSLAWSSNGQIVACCGESGKMILWNGETGEFIKAISLGPLKGTLRKVIPASEGRFFVLGGNGVVYLLDPSELK